MKNNPQSGPFNFALFFSVVSTTFLASFVSISKVKLLLDEMPFLWNLWLTLASLAFTLLVLAFLFVVWDKKLWGRFCASFKK